MMEDRDTQPRRGHLGGEVPPPVGFGSVGGESGEGDGGE